MLPAFCTAVTYIWLGWRSLWPTPWEAGMRHPETWLVMSVSFPASCQSSYQVGPSFSHLSAFPHLSYCPCSFFPGAVLISAADSGRKRTPEGFIWEFTAARETTSAAPIPFTWFLMFFLLHRELAGEGGYLYFPSLHLANFGLSFSIVPSPSFLFISPLFGCNLLTISPPLATKGTATFRKTAQAEGH